MLGRKKQPQTQSEISVMGYNYKVKPEVSRRRHHFGGLHRLAALALEGPEKPKKDINETAEAILGMLYALEWEPNAVTDALNALLPEHAVTYEPSVKAVQHDTSGERTATLEQPDIAEAWMGTSVMPVIFEQ